MMHLGTSHAGGLAQFEAMVETQSVMLATDKFFLTVALHHGRRRLQASG